MTRNHYRLSDAEVYEIYESYSDGIGQAALARKYKISVPTVRRILTGRARKYLSLKPFRMQKGAGAPSGTNNGNTKIDESKARKIKALLHIPHLSRAMIARETNTSEVIVRKIHMGITWKNV